MDDGLKFQQKESRLQRPRIPRSLPASPSERLSLKLSQTFRPDLPRVKSLTSFTKTYFVTDLPRHVGLSVACDLSMEAVCLAHATLLQSSSHSLVQSRIQYGRALAELQHCVADPTLARTMGTLCATMLLGIFEVCPRFHSP